MGYPLWSAILCSCTLADTRRFVWPMYTWLQLLFVILYTPWFSWFISTFLLFSDGSCKMLCCYYVVTSNYIPNFIIYSSDIRHVVPIFFYVDWRFGIFLFSARYFVGSLLLRRQRQETRRKIYQSEGELLRHICNCVTRYTLLFETW